MFFQKLGEKLKIKIMFSHLPLLVHRHVHPDQLLVRHLLRTLLAEAQRRINGPKHVKDFGVVNFTAEGSEN